MRGASSALRRMRMTVAYDGTAYGGWQIQPNAPSVQALLQAVLQRLGGGEIKVHGSGRTDAGVHARGQVAHFDWSGRLAAPALVRAMNACLPGDVRIMDVIAVDNGFHARKSAIGKEYRYFIWNQAVMPPCERLYRHHVPAVLNVQRMQDAADRLIGTHDFASFSANPKRFVETTVRTIHALTVTQVEARMTIAVSGDGFLYKMVRSLVGWLLRVGAGEMLPGDTDEILASGQRTARVPTAPPQGLFLWRVDY